MKFDFSGWATKANLKCSDGRVIMKDAFKHNDGKTVPLVWNHQHNGPDSIIGHALLENRNEGVYAYCALNDTENGQLAKQLVKHGDINALSIYANQLKQSMSNVVHGNIREVSLVLAGANPGAFIESVMAHGYESDDEAYIFTGEELDLYHSDDEDYEDDVEDETIEDILDTLSPKQMNAVYALVGMVAGEDEMSHSDDEDYEEYDDEEEDYDDEDYDEDETIEDILDTLDDKQAAAVYALLEDELEDTQGGDESMKHNVFENDQYADDQVLSHADMEVIIDDAKRFGSLRDSFMAHAEDYGIDNIEYLFPEARNVTDYPSFIQRDMGWVTKLMSSVSKSPFSRIKSLFADITEDEARAKGYLKGKLKKEEVFTLLKRTTSPTTIYKKQKMDRDDVVDITDFDVIAWLKTEMRMMLDEEIARAVLIGDGRMTSSDDKIKEDCIRPIVSDSELFTIQAPVKVKSTATDNEKARAFIRTAIKARKNYKGSGEPTLYTTEDVITDMLLIEDTTGRTIYDSIQKLATTLRVKDIVAVPVMEGYKNADDQPLMGIIVNPIDYRIGADKGGSINMFEDFDIDYNQQKYLIETRCSGALVKPFSAIVLNLDNKD